MEPVSRQKPLRLGAGAGVGAGDPVAAPTTRPPVAVQGADCFAHAALDATSTPGIDPGSLAQALDDADLTQAALWPH